MSLTCAPDVRPARLRPDDYAKRFARVTAPLSASAALLEAQRCLYCFAAPCSAACPTHIDVPSFIQRIADGNLRGSAASILQSNPLGGICARVCPVENLCEAVCVRQTQEQRPVAIARLQGFAVDALLQSGQAQIFQRAAPTGKKIAVVGAGPAGLACAHTLAKLGHEVVIFDRNAKPGGLNEYGLARYKTGHEFAQREVQWLLGIGGIELRQHWQLQSVAQFSGLRQDFAALFLALGLPSTHQLGIPGENLAGVSDAVQFIAKLRQCHDLSTLPIGHRVLVIGGGMTAIDAAVQAKLLGADEVHLCYRRGADAMPASLAEQHWAQTQGVVLHHWLAPVEISANAEQPNWVGGVRFARQTMQHGELLGSGERCSFEADMVLKAIGQTLHQEWLAQAGLVLHSGRIATDGNGLTSLPGVWAGGDCRAGGLDLTVAAVAQGQRAAQAMHAELMNL